MDNSSPLERLAHELACRYNGLYVRSDLKLHAARREFKRAFLTRQLELNLGNVARTAQRIGLSQRQFYSQMRILKINPDQYRPTEEEYQANPYKRSEVIAGILQRSAAAAHIDDCILQATKMLDDAPRYRYRQALEYFHKKYLAERFHGNQKETATSIGVPESTLSTIIARYGIQKTAENPPLYPDNQYIV